MALVPTAYGVTESVDLPDVMPASEEPVRYVVGFHGLPRDMDAGDTYNGAEVLRVDRVLHFAVVLVDAPALFEARTNADENVRYVEQDPILQLIQYTPNDPRFGELYGMQHIRAPEAWDTTLGDLDAKVCVVDTGVRYTHEDLAGARWLGGYDFVNGDNDPMDDNGHGTHVAGTAAGWIDNAKGVAGVGNVGIYGVKVLNYFGSGSLSGVASGIRWCADNGGDGTVINLSLGASSGAQELEDAVNYAWTKGALVVAAAGNSGPCTNCVGYPAAYDNAIAVTCTDENKGQCSFSSDGPQSEIAAPGNNILSTWYSSDTAYNTVSGTSMSSPHAAGAAALVWSHATSLTNSELRQLMRDTAQDLGSAGWDEQFGYGLVDAKALLDAAGGGGGDPGDPGDPTETLVYSEDFAAGAPGWHKSSSTADLWRLSGGCFGATVPAYSIQFNRGDSACDYNTGAQVVGWARSPVIDLSGYSSAKLSFQNAFEVESYPYGAYDVMQVQVSTDGGTSWTAIEQWDSRDTSNPSFHLVELDVSGYISGNFRVRFHFDSVDSVSNAYMGWAVDEVEVWAQ